MVTPLILSLPCSFSWSLLLFHPGVPWVVKAGWFWIFKMLSWSRSGLRESTVSMETSFLIVSLFPKTGQERTCGEGQWKCWGGGAAAYSGVPRGLRGWIFWEAFPALLSKSRKCLFLQVIMFSQRQMFSSSCDVTQRAVRAAIFNLFHLMAHMN